MRDSVIRLYIDLDARLDRWCIEIETTIDIACAIYSYVTNGTPNNRVLM